MVFLEICDGNLSPIVRCRTRMYGSGRRFVVCRIASALLMAGGAAAAIGPAALVSSSQARSVGSSCGQSSLPTTVQTIVLPGRPGFLLLRKNILWVAIKAPRSGLSRGRGAIARVDARTGAVQRILRIPFDPYQIAVGFGSLWLTGESNNRKFRGLVRLDPRSGHVVRVIYGPRLLGSKIAATSDGIWIGGADVYPKGHADRAGVRFVYKIDARRNAVVRQVQLPGTTVIALRAEGSSFWATGWGGVVKLSASGRPLFVRHFDGAGWSLALTPGAVWIAKPLSGSRSVPGSERPARQLLKIPTSDPSRKTTVIGLETPPGGVAASSGVVWAAANSGLARTDAAGTPTLTNVPLDFRLSWVEAFPGGVWISEQDGNRVRKIC